MPGSDCRFEAFRPKVPHQHSFLDLAVQRSFGQTGPQDDTRATNCRATLTVCVENYFNYFTEIEERFQRRRGTLLLLSTLDWALIETWKDAGIPLEAVLRGIDDTFDRWEARPSTTRKVNSLAYCAQAVLTAAEDMKEAAVGASRSETVPGIDRDDVAAYLRRNAAALAAASTRLSGTAASVARDGAASLEQLGAAPDSLTHLEDLERRLTVMEEKILAALTASASDDELLAVRAEADRDLAPFRRNLPASQIAQLHKQYVHKRLLERHELPRLSLFYM